MHADRRPRLEGEPRHPAVARVEVGRGCRRAGAPAIVVAQRARAARSSSRCRRRPRCARARRAPRRPARSAGRRASRSPRAGRCRQPRRAAASAAATPPVPPPATRTSQATSRAGGQSADRQHGDAGIAARRHPHHVDDRVEPALHRAPHLAIVLGSQRAICGNAITRPSAITCSPMYGQIERKMSPRRDVRAAPRPSGRTPPGRTAARCTRSACSCRTGRRARPGRSRASSATGTKIGAVSSRMPIQSMKQPRMIQISIMMRITPDRADRQAGHRVLDQLGAAGERVDADQRRRAEEQPVQHRRDLGRVIDGAAQLVPAELAVPRRRRAPRRRRRRRPPRWAWPSPCRASRAR